MMMRPSFASEACALNDRTGLKTTYPELLDENGEMTQEELWAVRFSDEVLLCLGLTIGFLVEPLESADF